MVKVIIEIIGQISSFFAVKSLVPTMTILNNMRHKEYCKVDENLATR